MGIVSSGFRAFSLSGIFLSGLLASAQVAAQVPVFTSGSRADFEMGVAATFAVTASSASAVSISMAGQLPSGLNFTDQGDGSATLGGTPGPGSQGRSNVVLTASNASGSATQNLSIVVSKAAELISAEYATFVIGSESSFSIYSDGEPSGTITVTGALPPGLSLSDVGFGQVRLSGTPSVGSAGNYPLTVAVNNSLGGDSQTLVITVLTAVPVDGDRNYSGMYYNPSSSGYAVNLTHQGNVLVAAWYTFAQSGRPVWFTAVTTRQPDGSFAGGYSVFTGLAFDQINNAQAYLTDSPAGTASFNFAPDGRLDFRFDAIGYAFPQQRNLVKVVFSSTPPVCRFTTASRIGAGNFTDLWWQPMESGWGLSIEHQGGLIFASWYTYAADGQPVWMTSLLSQNSDGSFNGAINRAESGIWYVHSVFGPITNFPVPEIGSAVLRFSSGERGSFSYVIDAVVQTKMIERIVFASPAQVCTTSTP